MAKDWLTAKGIPYTDYNVAENMDKRKEMVEITGQLGVPVIKIGNDVMVGFNPDHMAKLLEVDPSISAANDDQFKAAA